MVESQESKSQNLSISTQKPKKHSQSKPKQNTSHPSKGAPSSRDQKRKRWAKKSKPIPKPVKAAVLEYISKCCNVPARKPRAGTKETVKDPDTGKFVDQPKGLGHWRCGQCNKPCKVTPRKPECQVYLCGMESHG
jgi:hypothetical protein